jgi:2-amino-4-hydroxy-6-hydroxymethyldihydropteridine diphosphokinase
VAPLFRSTPLPPTDQPDFLNTALTGETTLAPEDLLALAKALELAAGRTRSERFGPRPLDIDLVLYGDRVRDAPELTLPHPRLRERRFMLAPLAEVAPAMAVPPTGATISELLEGLDTDGEVELVGWKDEGVELTPRAAEKPPPAPPGR